MKFCPYCGADLIEDGVSFCVECGKQLPDGKAQKERTKDAPQTRKNAKKKKKTSVQHNIEEESIVDDGYDGYYNDIRPIDEGHERDGVDKALVKKIAIIISVLFVVIAACVALMYVL